MTHDQNSIKNTIINALIEITGSTAWDNRRSRPYDGQIQTANGERGKTLVSGLTMRDIVDCFVVGALQSNGAEQPELYERAENGTWLTEDVYKLNWANIDPIAVAQNMTCNIEKMMGIYPNVPRLYFNGEEQ